MGEALIFEAGEDSKSSVARWRVVFHRGDVLPPSVRSDRAVVRHADAVQRACVRLPTGRPILMDSVGLPDVRVNRWFASDELRGQDPLTWRKYAYSLVVWLNFLAAYGLSWDEVDAESIEAFKVWRTADERNERTVAPGTFKHDLIAIQQFYRWALDEYGVRNPIRVRRGRWRRWDGTVSERPIAAPKATRDRNVKWFDPAGFARYRDVGLLGLTFDGDEDPDFGGVIRSGTAPLQKASTALVCGWRNGDPSCWSSCRPRAPARPMRRVILRRRRRRAGGAASIGCLARLWVRSSTMSRVSGRRPCVAPSGRVVTG